MLFISFIQRIVANGPQYLEIPMASDGQGYSSYLVTNVPTGEPWQMTITNQDGTGAPVAEFVSGSQAPILIQPVLAESSSFGYGNTQNPPTNIMSTGISTEVPSGPAPVPVSGGMYDPNTPQAGSTSEASKSTSSTSTSSKNDKSSSTTNSKSKTSSKDKEKEKEKKNNAKAIGAVAGVLGVLFCLLAA
ncbi:hypothetical protein M153_4420006276 [Pseudoloma neurophilia]|uniref:Uncharacterized protein n=1 Tax=Pseudoloma neurophilia TaxID=146866 RepID=A0A0R0M3I9_9MICR|nr:hypothetical protein M153_4420006276 [Pseudoloma neurophilia]